MITSTTVPSRSPLSKWRNMCNLSSPAVAAILSARCRFSLQTAEVISNRADASFALVEQERPDLWRWAVYGVEDVALHEGTAPTRERASALALAALALLDTPCPISA